MKLLCIDFAIKYKFFVNLEFSDKTIKAKKHIFIAKEDLKSGLVHQLTYIHKLKIRKKFKLKN